MEEHSDIGSGSPDNKTKSSSSSAWMLTFADLLSLILTFFILLYSMTQLQKSEWNKIVRSFHEQFKMEKEAQTLEIPDPYGIEAIDVAPALDIDYLYTLLNQKLQSDAAAETLSVKLLDDRLVISLANKTFFRNGQAELNEEAEATLAILGEIISTLNNRIDVYGHTDSTPITTARYPSNWELSLTRAIVIAETLHKYGSQSSIQAFGLSDAQYKFLPEDLRSEEKSALANRVDIVIRQSQAENIIGGIGISTENE